MDPASLKTPFKVSSGGFLGIPVEVQCLIFKFLSNDKESLSAARTVCTGWRDLIDANFFLANIFLSDTVRSQSNSKTFRKIDTLFTENYNGPSLTQEPGYWQTPADFKGLRCRKLQIGRENSKENVQNLLNNYGSSITSLNLHSQSLAEFYAYELQNLDLSRVTEFAFNITFRMKMYVQEDLQNHIGAVIEILNSALFGNITSFKVNVAIPETDRGGPHDYFEQIGYDLSDFDGEFWTPVRTFIAKHSACITSLDWAENTHATHSIDLFRQLRFTKLGINLLPQHPIPPLVHPYLNVQNIIKLQKNTLESLNLQIKGGPLELYQFLPSIRQLAKLKSLELSLKYTGQVNEFDLNLTYPLVFVPIERLKINLELFEAAQRIGTEKLKIANSPCLLWQDSFARFCACFGSRVKVLEIDSFLNFKLTSAQTQNLLDKLPCLEKVRVTILNDTGFVHRQLEDCYVNLFDVAAWANQTAGLKASLHTKIKLRRYSFGTLLMPHFVLELQLLNRREFNATLGLRIPVHGNGVKLNFPVEPQPSTSKA